MPPVVFVCMIFAHACVVTVVVALSPKDPGFISYVVSLMRPEYCVPNDLVFREGDVGKEMYFLVQGLMEVVVKIGTAEETTYGQIEEGDYFGINTPVMQAGYVIGDRVLRPALVGVSKGGPKERKPEGEAPAAEPGSTVDRTA